jgi:hypothetical protein
MKESTRHFNRTNVEITPVVVQVQWKTCNISGVAGIPAAAKIAADADKVVMALGVDLSWAHEVIPTHLAVTRSSYLLQRFVVF